jgi:hypothetical protein
LFCANPRNDPRTPTCRLKLGIVAERFERIVARIKTDRDHAYILARLHEVVMEISKITASDLTYRWTGCVNKLNQDKFIWLWAQELVGPVLIFKYNVRNVGAMFLPPLPAARLLL